MSSEMKEAFVTLATNDTYALGALVLANSLKNQKTTRKIVILITPGVTDSMRNHLSTTFDVVQEVDLMRSKEESILAVMKRPELGVTITKIHCWRLTQFEKCVFMDADTLVLQNIDELFEREEISATPDIGWPDCFNTGVFVFKPSEETFQALLKLAAEDGTFDGGDQGLLNTYFSDWNTKDIKKHLSFIYNMTSIAVYSYPPAYKKFGTNVKVIHFLGSLKPWHYSYNVATGLVSSPPGVSGFQQLEHIQMWWNLFISQVQKHLDSECSGLAGSLAKLSLESGQHTGGQETQVLDDETRRNMWERGQMDYLGSDSFANIQRKLDEVIEGNRK